MKNTKAEAEPVHTVEDVAERFKLHHNTVRKLLRAGKIRGVKIGRRIRILESSLLSWQASLPSTAGGAS